MANISGKKQDIVEQKNGAVNCNFSCACALNLVNFGPRTAKNRTCVSTDLTRSPYVGHVSYVDRTSGIGGFEGSGGVRASSSSVAA